MDETPLKLSDIQCSDYFLEPSDIGIFAKSARPNQEYMVNEWKSMKPFLSNFPAETLPKKFLRIPKGKKRPKYKFHYGWATDWKEILAFVQNHFSEKEVRMDASGKPDPVATSLHCVHLIAQLCGLRYLTLQSAWIGPRTSQLRPVFAISSNYKTDVHRKELASAAGVKKLQEYFGLQGPPRWVVDPFNIKSWPKF